MLHLRKCIVAVFVILCLGVLAILMKTGPSRIQPHSFTRLPYRYLQTGLRSHSEILNILKEQRNTLAKQLNELRQQLGRIDCEVRSITQMSRVVRKQTMWLPNTNRAVQAQKMAKGWIFWL